MLKQKKWKKEHSYMIRNAKQCQEKEDTIKVQKMTNKYIKVILWALHIRVSQELYQEPPGLLYFGL